MPRSEDESETSIAQRQPVSSRWGSIYRGVQKKTFGRRAVPRYYATARYKGKNVYLGAYAREEDAGKAYDAAQHLMYAGRLISHTELNHRLNFAGPPDAAILASVHEVIQKCEARMPTMMLSHYAQQVDALLSTMEDIFDGFDDEELQMLDAESRDFYEAAQDYRLAKANSASKKRRL